MRYNGRVALCLSEPLDALVHHTHALIEASHEQIRIARKLRERSQLLLADNADLREFLQETILIVYSRHEKWVEETAQRG